MKQICFKWMNKIKPQGEKQLNGENQCSRQGVESNDHKDILWTQEKSGGRENYSKEVENIKRANQSWRMQ